MSVNSKKTVGTHLENVTIPRSTIFVNETDTLPTVRNSKKKLSSGITKLIFDHAYDADTIMNCKGNHSCYNCSCPIHGRIYFIPVSFDKFGQPTFSPLSHCGKSCVLRTCVDMSMKYENYLSFFYRFYGHNVKCAPPRGLLYIPNGMTKEQYVDTLDEDTVYEFEEPNILPFFAPVVVSHTLLNKNQVDDGTKMVIDEHYEDIEKFVKKTLKNKPQSNRVVITLPSSDKIKPKVSETFEVSAS